MTKSINGIFIIISNSIGAGLLGMPIICSITGFIPSVILMLLIAIYMNMMARSIIKTSIIYKSNNILHLSEKTIGKSFKIIGLIIYILLFTSILSAYISKSEDLIQEILNLFTNINIKSEICYLIIISTTTIIINLKKTNFNNINNILILIFIIIFILLIYKLFKNSKITHMVTYDVTNIKYTYPILITSFGFHNILPYIKTTYKKYKKIKKIINIGVALTFCIYTIWIFIILSIIPTEKLNMIHEYNNDKIITEIVSNYIDQKNICIMINAFALLAIITSILGISVSMKSLFNELLNLNNNISDKIILNALIFLPPILIIMTCKNIFFTALNISGGIFALILFGLIPNIIILKNKNNKFKKKTLFIAKFLTIITVLIIILFITLNI